MRTKRANIDDFLHRTKADILAGYRKDVDFILATAEEMSFLYQNNELLFKSLVIIENLKTITAIKH